MRASGSYYRIVDNSLGSSDNVAMTCLLPMMLKKGEQVQVVTFSDFEDKVGYDLAYNPLYLGLKNLLQSVSRVTLFRLNKEPAYGNVIITKAGNSLSKTAVIDKDIFNASVKTKTVVQDMTAYPTTIPFALDIVEDTLTIKSGATLQAHDDGDGNLVADNGSGIIGTVVYASGVVSLSAGPVAVLTSEASVDEAYSVLMKTPGNWATLRIKLTDCYESINLQTGTTLSIGKGVESGSVLIYDSSGGLIAHSTGTSIVEDNSSGVSGTIVNSTGVITLGTAPVSLTLLIEYITAVTADKLYTLTISEVVDSVAIVVETVVVSLVDGNALFIGDLEFENVIIQWEEIPTIPIIGVSPTITMTGATDGTMPSASDIDMTKIVSAEGFFVAMNGLADYGIIGKFQTFCDDYDRICLIDCPNFTTYASAFAWSLGLAASEKSALFAVSEQQVIDLKVYSVYPTIKILQAYASMFKQTGSLNYPVAGYTYGGISVESLYATDFSGYRDELKTNKINYLMIGSSGPVIWEQRTRYASESDLTYLHANIILIQFAARLVKYGSQFDFKLIGPSELNMMQTGIEDIISEYVVKNFLWSGSVKVPSWSAVLESGVRTVDIPVTIKIAEDSEERTFVIELNKSGT